jgi:hypothetical protein
MEASNHHYWFDNPKTQGLEPLKPFKLFQTLQTWEYGLMYTIFGPRLSYLEVKTLVCTTLKLLDLTRSSYWFIHLL